MMMAKDAAIPGRVSNPDGGFYKTSEEIRKENADRLAAQEEAKQPAEEEEKKDD